MTSDKSGCGCIIEVLGLGKCSQKCRKSASPRIPACWHARVSCARFVCVCENAAQGIDFGRLLVHSPAQESLYRYDLAEAMCALTYEFIFRYEESLLVGLLG